MIFVHLFYISDYGTITAPSVDETPFKDPLEKTKDDPTVSKKETPPSTPTKKEHAKLARTANPTSERSPLLEAPPSKFGKKGTPKSSPKGSPKPSPKPSPIGSPKASPGGSPKLVRNGSAGKQKAEKKKSSPTTDRPSSKDYSKFEDEQSTGATHQTPPVSPSRLTLLELAQKANGKPSPASSRDNLDQDTALESQNSSDEEALLKATFDNTPVCMSSGDELSPKPAHQQASLGLKGYSKTDEKNASSSSLSKGKAKAQDAVKKTSKNVKKMFKFGGGKKKEKEDKKEKKEKKDKKKKDADKKVDKPKDSKTETKEDISKGAVSKIKSNVTFSASTKSQVTGTKSMPAATESK